MGSPRIPLGRYHQWNQKQKHQALDCCSCTRSDALDCCSCTRSDLLGLRAVRPIRAIHPGLHILYTSSRYCGSDGDLTGILIILIMVVGVATHFALRIAR
jgi:hypothetical protein